MPTKSHKGLTVFYIVSAALVVIFLALVGNWDSDGFGGDLVWAIVFGVFVIFLLTSAIECWFSRTQRNIFQQILVWGPIFLAGVFLFLTILNGVVNG